jgi:hypothetical protein
LILYTFLGIFVIFIVDSFSRSGKYVRWKNIWNVRSGRNDEIHVINNKMKVYLLTHY